MPRTVNRSHSTPQFPTATPIGVHVLGSGQVRILGIDSPEKAFELPGSSGAARRLDGPEWDTYLTDPFQQQFGPFDLDQPLIDHLRARVGSDAADNHSRHGKKAEQAITTLVSSDIPALGQDLDTFGFFLSFSFEVFDTFGRFLAFINRNQPDPNNPCPRPLSYNERMLQTGSALPLFIWPNIDPLREGSLLEAVLAPGTANDVGESTPALRQARPPSPRRRTWRFRFGRPTSFRSL